MDQEKKDKLKKLIRNITEHTQGASGTRDMALWENILKEFPQCEYFGTAYRAVIPPDPFDGEFSEERLKHCGYSWALTLDGVKDFITCGDCYDMKKDEGFHLARATIRGVSLIHIYHFMKEEFPDLIDTSIVDEEEIISLEVLSLDKLVFAPSYKTIPSVD